MTREEIQYWQATGSEAEKKFVSIFEDRKLKKIINKHTSSGHPVVVCYDYEKQFRKVRIYSYEKLMGMLEILLDNVLVEKIKIMVSTVYNKKIMEWSND
jgi:hypothetical protein